MNGILALELPVSFFVDICGRVYSLLPTPIYTSYWWALSECILCLLILRVQLEPLSPRSSSNSRTVQILRALSTQHYS